MMTKRALLPGGAVVERVAHALQIGADRGRAVEVGGAERVADALGLREVGLKRRNADSRWRGWHRSRDCRASGRSRCRHRRAAGRPRRATAMSASLPFSVRSPTWMTNLTPLLMNCWLIWLMIETETPFGFCPAGSVATVHCVSDMTPNLQGAANADEAPITTIVSASVKLKSFLILNTFSIFCFIQMTSCYEFLDLCALPKITLAPPTPWTVHADPVFITFSSFLWTLPQSGRPLVRD